MNRRTRLVLIASIVVVAIVGFVSGVRAWSIANQREETAEAFSVLRTVDRRIDLPRYVPDMKRTESGVAVRLEGDGPAITYSFNASETPDWQARINDAMKQAGYGDAPWDIHVRGAEVEVVPGPADSDHDRVIVLIATE